MSARTFSVVFAGAGSADLPQGRFFYIKAAAAAITVETRGTPGLPARFENIGAGARFRASEKQAWRSLHIESGIAQTVEIVISSEGEFDVASAVSVTGVTTVTAQPTAAGATPARVALNAAGDTLIAAANPNRKRMRIQVPSTEANSAVIGPTGSLGAAQGFEIQPGTNEPWDCTAAVYGRGVGGNTNVQVLEET